MTFVLFYFSVLFWGETFFVKQFGGVGGGGLVGFWPMKSLKFGGKKKGEYIV
jgi:hypothetical protein